MGESENNDVEMVLAAQSSVSAQDAAHDDVEEQTLIATRLVQVRLMGEDDLVEQSSKSIHFYAMMRSLQLNQVLQLSTLLSIATLLVQLTMLHSFMHSRYIYELLDGQSAKLTWANVGLHEEFAHGGPYAMMAWALATAFAPMVLVAKMAQQNEFGQTPVFRATMRSILFYSPHLDSPCKTMVLYCLWTLVYAVRAYLIVAYMAFVNACFAASVDSLKSVVLSSLVVAFLLDLDDYAFSVFFSVRSRIGAVRHGEFSRIKIGRQTLEACERIRERTTTVVAVAQVVLLVVIKSSPMMLLILAVPAVAALLAATQALEFPRFEPPLWTLYAAPYCKISMGTELALLALLCAWMVAMAPYLNWAISGGADAP